MKAGGGAELVLLSAALFGLSPLLAKALVGDLSAFVLAGLLYLGSGLGLLIYILLRGIPLLAELRALPARHRGHLARAIIAGGVLAPLALAQSVRLLPAFEVSVLLNLETVATTLIAALFFKEPLSLRLWGSKALIVAGAIGISLSGDGQLALSSGALLAAAACVLWGIDNNFTRDIDSLSPSVLAAFKGLVAGSINLAIGLASGTPPASIGTVSAILAVGAVCYGVSLVLFVQGLRRVGAARAGTYFAAGPFFGMLASVVVGGERPLPHQWLASAVIAAGVWILTRENHEHPHLHPAETHRHEHVHDAHHQHAHPDGKADERHEHEHSHEPLAHTHGHLPDIHHRHVHPRTEEKE